MPASSPLARLWERALDVVFPPRCVSCRRFGEFICHVCASLLQPALRPRCDVCWEPCAGDRCRSCSRGRRRFKKARSSVTYEGPARDAVLALKFRGVSSVAPLMARLMAGTLGDWAPGVEAVIHVPLSGGRRRERGYDQAELLAREVARLCGLPFLRRALVRRRATAPQSGRPNYQARQANVAGAFAVRVRPLPRAVLLVDDVITTGATADECAGVLREAGVEAVYVLTFARED